MSLFVKRIISFCSDIIPKIYENQICNEFYFYVCIAGGILRTKKVCYNNRFKRVWIIYQIIGVILPISSTVAYFFTTEEKNLWTFWSASHVVFANFGISLIFATMYYYFENFENFIERMDQYLKMYEHRNRAKNVEILPVAIVLSPYCYPIMGMLKKLQIPETDLNNVDLYFFAFPRALEINSIGAYFIMSFVQISTTLHITITLYSVLKIVSVCSAQQCSTLEELSEILKQCSESTFKQLEDNHNQELQLEENSIILRNQNAEAFINQRKIFIKNFDHMIIMITKRHWTLFTIKNLLKEPVEMGYSGFVLMFCVMNIPLGSILMGTLTRFTQFNLWTLFALNVILLSTYMLYTYFNLVETTEEKNREFSFQVYSTPWYLLPKQSRKNIYILLTQTQYIHQWYIFKFLPLNFSAIPQILNTCYSYIMVIQTLVKKSKSG